MSALFFIVSLLDLLNMIDLRSLLLLAGVPDGKVGGALAFVSFVYLFLRWFTSTPMFLHLREGDVVVAVPATMKEDVVAAVAATEGVGIGEARA